MHPLIPLAYHPSLLRLMPLISKPALSLLLCISSAAIVLLLIKRDSRSAFIAVVALIPWFLPFPSHIKTKPPTWLAKIVWLPTLFPPSDQPEAMVQFVGKQFCKIVDQYPETDLIILPESSFYIDNLEQLLILHGNHWHETMVGKPLHIIAGSFRWSESYYYNCAYWIYNGTIKQWHDKRHTLFFVEQTPAWFAIKTLSELYFKKSSAITPAKMTAKPFKIDDFCPLIPYLCSELFFSEYPNDNHPDATVIALCNDWWFRMRYMKRLMQLAAQFKAIQWQRDIIYISYSAAFLFDRHGNLYPIQPYYCT